METFLMGYFQNYNLSLLILISISLFFGASMKLADVFDEHGVKEYFYGAKILSGFVWGYLGALLIWYDLYVGSAILAMILAYIVRMRIDYRNHAIGATLVILAFLLFRNLDIISFFFFFGFFLIFGFMKDYFQYYSKKKKDLLNKNIIYNTIIWFYPISSFIYSLIYSRWSVFISLVSFNLAYALVKIYYQKRV